MPTANVDRVDATRWRTTPRCSTTWPRCASPTTPPRRCSSAPRADWAAGVEHADWPVRLVGDPDRSSSTRRFEIVDRALDLSGGRGRVQAQPARAAVPRRAHGTLPPRQHAPRARADRQAVPGRRSRRPATLGLVQERIPHASTRPKVLSVAASTTRHADNVITGAVSSGYRTNRSVSLRRGSMKIDPELTFNSDTSRCQHDGSH